MRVEAMTKNNFAPLKRREISETAATDVPCLREQNPGQDPVHQPETAGAPERDKPPKKVKILGCAQQILDTQGPRARGQITK